MLIAPHTAGTVRAYDLVRYRNFRTMTSPKPAQVSGGADHSVGVDYSVGVATVLVLITVLVVIVNGGDNRVWYDCCRCWLDLVPEVPKHPNVNKC
jgi:hypothetical protein